MTEKKTIKGTKKVKDYSNRFICNSDQRLQVHSEKPVQKKAGGKEIPMNSEPIDSELVRDFVRNQIEFQLTDEQWYVIDEAMDNYWNSNKPGTTIYSEDNAAKIYNHCVQERLLISYDRVIKITDAIWNYLEIKGYLLKY